MEAVTRQWQNISDDDASFWRQRSRESVYLQDVTPMA